MRLSLNRRNGFNYRLSYSDIAEVWSNIVQFTVDTDFGFYVNGVPFFDLVVYATGQGEHGNPLPPGSILFGGSFDIHR